MNPGLAYAALAFVAWGLFPLYFRALATVDALEVALHRSAWSLVFVAAVLVALRRWDGIVPLLREPRRLLPFLASAVLLFGNWLLYVWAVQNGRVLEASLGYFINPLVSVALGVLVLRERLNRVQWLAVAIALAGVAWLTALLGHPPWVALALALSFGLYGLLRKTSPLGAIEGFALETLLLAPLVLPWLAWLSLQPGSGLGRGDAGLTALLVLCGPLTALPLMWFAAGARRLPLATLGLMQYLSPTLQFLVALWIFREPFDGSRLIGFVLIWLALALYSGDLLRRGRGAAPAPSPAPPGNG
jgi:chloramphenicol-sensitive protein RarD